MLRSRKGCLKVVCSSWLPLKRASSVVSLEVAGGDDSSGQFGGDDVDGSGLCRGLGASASRDVFEVRVEGDRHGRGEGPRSGGPDDGVDFAAGKRGIERPGVGGEPVAHVDRWAGVHLVFDFGFGKGGAVVDAPVDRLESAIDEALLEEAVERLQRAGLVVAAPWSCRACPSGRRRRCAQIARSAGRRISARRRGMHPGPQERASPAFCGQAVRRP